MAKKRIVLANREDNSSFFMLPRVKLDIVNTGDSDDVITAYGGN